MITISITVTRMWVTIAKLHDSNLGSKAVTSQEILNDLVSSGSVVLEVETMARTWLDVCLESGRRWVSR
jgi:hypothetical protein